jgi:hypothetical protein
MTHQPGAGGTRSASNEVSRPAACPEPVASPRHYVVLPMETIPNRLDLLTLPPGHGPGSVPHPGVVS